MTDATPTPAYLSALSSYLRGAEESALLWAYEYGREALDEQKGVLELGELHRDAVACRPGPSHTLFDSHTLHSGCDGPAGCAVASPGCDGQRGDLGRRSAHSPRLHARTRSVNDSLLPRRYR